MFALARTVFRASAVSFVNASPQSVKHVHSMTRFRCKLHGQSFVPVGQLAPALTLAPILWNHPFQACRHGSKQFYGKGRATFHDGIFHEEADSVMEILGEFHDGTANCHGMTGGSSWKIADLTGSSNLCDGVPTQRR